MALNYTTSLYAAKGADVFPYQIDYSALLDGSSDYLSFTPAAGGNAKVWTFRIHLKASDLGTYRTLLSAGGSNDYELIDITENNQVRWLAKPNGTVRGSYVSEALIADPTGWGDLVISRNGTTITMEWNGQTLSLTESTAAQDVDGKFNTAVNHNMFRYVVTSDKYYSGYAASVYFLDGQALPASTWGEFSDRVTGLWVPKDPGTLTYGTNGFHLDFSDAANLGKDARVELGEELIDDVTAWTTAMNWSDDGIDAVSGNLPTTWNAARKDILTAGKKYLVEADVSIASGGFRFQGGTDGTGASAVITTSGHVAAIITTDDVWFKIMATTADLVCSITNISVKEITAGANHWTVNGSPVQTVDTPTNNQPVFNALQSEMQSGLGAASLSNGNRTITYASANNGAALTTPIPLTGQWSAQMTWDAVTQKNNTFVGICDEAFLAGLYYNAGIGHFIGYATNGDTYIDLASATYGAGITAGDSVDINVDMDAGEVSFSLNGVDQGVADDTLVAGRQWYFVAFLSGTSTLTYSPDATPPDGFATLSTSNLSDPTILKSSEYADIVLREGTGAEAVISSLDFQPDFVNGKDRDNARSWAMFDSENLATNYLQTDTTAALQTDAQSLKSFDSSGYTLGTSSVTNHSGASFIDLCLKAGVDQGFEIVTWDGDGTQDRLIPHGLTNAPTFIVVKKTNTTSIWLTYHQALGQDKYLDLSGNAAAVNLAGIWNTVNATDFAISGNTWNAVGETYTAYLFTDSDIFKAFSYTGNALTDGPFVNLGGKPLAVPFLKNSTDAVDWYNLDGVRDPFNPIAQHLIPNDSVVEGTSQWSNFTSQGVKVIGSGNDYNGSGDFFVGLAVLESTKYSNAF